MYPIFIGCPINNSILKHWHTITVHKTRLASHYPTPKCLKMWKHWVSDAIQMRQWQEWQRYWGECWSKLGNLLPLSLGYKICCKNISPYKNHRKKQVIKNRVLKFLSVVWRRFASIISEEIFLHRDMKRLRMRRSKALLKTFWESQKINY